MSVLAAGIVAGLAVLVAPGRDRRGLSTARRSAPEPDTSLAHGSGASSAPPPDVASARGVSGAGACEVSPDLGQLPFTLREIAECADLLAVALSGGAALLGALDVVAEVVAGRPGRDLRVVAAALRWGVSTPDAWALVPSAWEPVASAFTIADRAGVAPSGLLRESARALRHTEVQLASERAGELSATIALPLGLTFLPGFVLTTIVPIVLALARQVTSP